MRGTTRDMSDSRVPLRNRQGDVVAEVKVDAEDYDRLMQWRWSLSPRGCAYRREQRAGVQKEMKMHRFIMDAGPGDPMVDHINRDPLDNRRANLRFATSAQNSQNRSGNRGTSVHRGVFWDDGVKKWRAQHTLNRKTIYIGIFPSEEDAAAAALVWRQEHMPFSVEPADA